MLSNIACLRDTKCSLSLEKTNYPQCQIRTRVETRLSQGFSELVIDFVNYIISNTFYFQPVS